MAESAGKGRAASVKVDGERVTLNAEGVKQTEGRVGETIADGLRAAVKAAGAEISSD